MDLDWKPIVKSRSRIDIPVVLVSHTAAARERYRTGSSLYIQSLINKSKRYRYSALGEYAELARSGRFVLPFKGETQLRRFTELHAALVLEQEGFICWGGVHLFYNRLDGLEPTGKKTAKHCTKEVQSRWSCRWPNEVEGELNFTPKNPDLVAYLPKGKEWRFCEVKERNEEIHPNQLRALGVLHLLTSAPVAIVRVVLDSTVGISRKLRSEITYKTATIAYKRGARLDWIHAGLREKCQLPNLTRITKPLQMRGLRGLP